jgi:GTP-binding protein
VLAHVIDCATLEPGRDPLTDLDVIEEELAAYVPDADLGGRPLAERTRVIILNKADVPEARELAEMVTPDLEERGYEVHIVSAVAHTGLNELTYALGRLVTAARAEFAEVVPQRIVLRPRAVDDSGFVVRREETPDGPAYRVVGERPTRWVRQTDFTNDEAVGYLADRLGRLGVEEALVKAGAVSGDMVLIGAHDDAVVFDWEPTLVSGAELLGQRGSDLRLAESKRASRDEKREAARDRYVARQATQSDLEAERRAGHWATARDDGDEG